MRLAALMVTLTAAIPAAAAAQDSGPGARICLAPASAEMAAGNTAEAVTAVRETFTSFLTGPSLGVTPLTARLESQAREEARAAGCPYVLFTELRHERKSGGGGLLGEVTGRAVQEGAWSAGINSGSTVGRVAASAVAGAAGEAAASLAGSVQTKDELTLTYRLESPDGSVSLDKKAKRKAKADGEDLLTPLVEQAAEAIASAVAQRES